MLVVAAECTAYSGVGEVMKPAVVEAGKAEPTADRAEPGAKAGPTNA